MRPQYVCYHELICDNFPATDAVAFADLSLLLSYAYNQKKIIEIGTRYARTTVNLAKFCATDGHVFSVDMDQKQHELYNSFIEPYKNKITFIEENTLTVDWGKYSQLKDADMILIDGCHDYNGVLRDTNAALNFIKKGGFIFWHDFVDGNKHDPEEPLMGKPGIVCEVIRELNLPVLPVGQYLGMLVC
jgi:predicted O-methyltransferase YrrM